MKTQRLSKKRLSGLFLFLSLMILLLIPCAFAINNFEEYQEIGTFNSGTDASRPSRGMSNNPVGLPLAGDLDGDTVTEIVIFDGNNVEIFQNQNSLSAISSATCNGTIDHGILHDYDDDGTLEVIAVGGGKWCLFDFDGENLTLSYSIAVSSWAGDKAMVGCYDTQCVVVTGDNNRYLSADYLNGTSSVDGTLVYDAGAGGPESWIGSKYLNVEVNPHNLIDNSEFIEYTIVMDDRFYGTYNSYVLTLQTNTTEVYLQASNRITGSNHDETTQFYSQALTYNFDGASQGYEVVVAQMTTDNDFVFYVFDENLVDMHQRPTVTDIVEDIPNEGQLVSNPVRMNGLRGTNTEDVCALGYDEDDDNMELLCYDITAGVLDPDGFDGFTGDTPFDITGDDNIIILPVQTSGTTQSGQNLNEILTPYGIYSLCYNCGALNSDTLVQEFSIGLDAGTASFYDVQGIGASDILFTTENTFYYIDDNEANLVPEITFSEFNPGNANGLPVCINEQVKITIEVNDNEGNPITCYYEEQYVNGTVASTGANQSITVAGSIIWFTTADEAGTFLYQFYCNDGYHATAGTKTEQLVVGAVNVTQCNTFDEGVSSTAYDTTSTSNDPTADNSLVQLLTTVNDLNGIGFTSLWILLMLGVAVGIWYQAGHGSASVTSQTWGVIGLVEIGLLVVGVMQRFIGFGVIAVLVILSLAILAFRFRDEIAGR